MKKCQKVQAHQKKQLVVLVTLILDVHGPCCKTSEGWDSPSPTIPLFSPLPLFFSFLLPDGTPHVNHSDSSLSLGQSGLGLPILQNHHCRDTQRISAVKEESVCTSAWHDPWAECPCCCTVFILVESPRADSGNIEVTSWENYVIYCYTEPALVQLQLCLIYNLQCIYETKFKIIISKMLSLRALENITINYISHNVLTMLLLCWKGRLKPIPAPTRLVVSLMWFYIRNH